MPPIRVMLAELPTGLREALSPAVAGQADMELVGEVDSPVEILLAAGQRQADVVVLGMPGRELPGIAGQLLDEYPQLKVLAVNLHRRQALLYELQPQLVLLGEVTAAALLDAIRTAVQTEVT
jgi:DNA-binding NarL/FixJ family response regulator